MNCYLILFAFLTSTLSFGRIPIKRTLVQNNLEQVDDAAIQITADSLEVQMARGQMDITAFLLWFIFGALGVHRFYMGDIGIGILQLLTFGGSGFWWLIDGIKIITGY